jgi:hypothetical protein
VLSEITFKSFLDDRLWNKWYQVRKAGTLLPHLRRSRKIPLAFPALTDGAIDCRSFGPEAHRAVIHRTVAAAKALPVTGSLDLLAPCSGLSYTWPTI